MIREFANWLFSHLSNLFGTLFSFLGSLFSGLFEGLKSLLTFLFTPILQFFGTIFYFLYKLGMLIISVAEIMFRLVFFFAYIMKGLFVTLIGLSYNGAAPNLPPRYAEIFAKLQPALELAQVNKLATLCLFAIWVMVGIACIKVIGARR